MKKNNNNTKINIKENKVLNKTYSILFTVAIILLYLVLPSIINLVLKNSFGMDSKVLVSIIGSVLTLLILILIFNRTLIKQFGDFKKNYKKYMKFTVKCWAIGLGIMMFSNLIINFVVFNGTIAGNEESVRELMMKYPVYVMISACLFAPIGEELAFRLGFRKNFKKAIPFALTTAVVFAGLHVITDFNSVKDLLYFIPYGSLGFAFGYAYFKTDNIFSSMTMHFIHNTITYSLIMITYWGM